MCGQLPLHNTNLVFLSGLSIPGPGPAYRDQALRTPAYKSLWKVSPGIPHDRSCLLYGQFHIAVSLGSPCSVVLGMSYFCSGITM